MRRASRQDQLSETRRTEKSLASYSLFFAGLVFSNLYFANGWLGYLPTAKAFEEGGYEPRTSPFTERVERDLAEGVIAFLNGLPR